MDKKDKTQNPPQLSVYNYVNFRNYLRDFYKSRKESLKGYSFRVFSKAAGFTSPNILKLVMEGKRNLTNPSIEKFIKGLGLSGKVAEYFNHLVKFNQATDNEEKKSHYEQLKRLIPHTQKRQLDFATVEYLNHWLYPVLREMVQAKQFREDPYWISRRLTGRATTTEITGALKFLEHHGFLKRDSKGELVNVDKMILSSDEVRCMAICQYHKKVLKQAIDTLDDLEMEKREFGAIIFILPKEAFSTLKSKIKEFRQELHLWALQQQQINLPDDNVIQVNIQMYPQTKLAKKQKDIEGA